MYTSEEPVLFLTQELPINPETPAGLFLLKDIKAYLLKPHDEGCCCLLIIDEAHKISDDVLK